MGCHPALFRNVSCSIQGKSARRRLKSGTAAAPAGPAIATPATPERKLRRSGFMRLVYLAVDYEAMWKRLSCLLLLAALVHAQTQRRVFSRIMTSEPYTLECY